jgi:type IV pilus assembly protein PilW
MQQDDQIARLQENGRWALRYLSRELVMAGFFGNRIDGDGIGTALLIADDCDAGWALNASVPLEHLDDPTPVEATTAYDCLDEAEVQPGTDILAVRRTVDTPLMEDGTAGSALENNTVYLRLEQFGSAGQLVRGSEFSLADITAGSGVDAWEYRPLLVFVRPFADAPGDDIPTLCIKRLSTDAAAVAVEDTECLVEGIENLQIEFGLDQTEPPDYTADFYTASPTPDQLDQAVNARIYVLVRSLSEVPGYTNDKSYNLGETTVAALNDGYYRRLMQTTVVLRNGEVYGL